MMMMQVLRFSRLFGVGKASSLPQVWRHVKKRRKKRKQAQEAHGSDSGSDIETSRSKKRGWTFNYARQPSPKHLPSDDEVSSLLQFLVTYHGVTSITTKTIVSLNI
jgi:transcription initiation factor TFIID subunit 1